jgi:hypothetical protein
MIASLLACDEDRHRHDGFKQLSARCVDPAVFPAADFCAAGERR